MKSYLALIGMNLRLALRERSVLFFNYVFPLIFFFGFGQFLGGRAGGAAMTRVVSMVLVIGILGSGLFGAGMRAVLERETGILRRYKVMPMTPLPLLVSSLVTGWLLYLPSAAIILALSHFVYHMPLPASPGALFVIISLGCLAFRAIGLIVASVANSMAESNVLIQILYMPMLFLSGATIPVSAMPVTAQIVSQFLPASYLNSGVQHVMLRAQGLAANLEAVGALIVSTVVATIISFKLFRWEKEEKLPNSSKAWVLAVLLPFLVLGTYQAWSREHIDQTKQLDREIRRKQTRLVRGATIFVGDGTVIRNGGVLLRGGRIEQVYSDRVPDPDAVNAEAVEAAGKTVLPGLIDVHVHLGSPGGTIEKMEDYDVPSAMQRELAAYLYSGVTAVASVGDFTGSVLTVARQVNSGARLGAELFPCGPLFTAPGGHGTEYFKKAPELLRRMAEEQFTRLPQTAEQAGPMVAQLKRDGCTCIKAVLESGFGGMLFQRMDVSVLRGIAAQAKAEHVPLVVHTGDSRDVADAVDAGASGIEHGSFRDTLPADLLARLQQRGVFYDPTLSVVEAFSQAVRKQTTLLGRSLVEQVAPAGMLAATRKAIESSSAMAMDNALERGPIALDRAAGNLVLAWRAGVPLVTGTDSGNVMLIHGPAVHRELQLWVQAGLPPAVALQAATHNAARLLGAGNRIGLVKAGYEASLLIVDGNPLEDISATERISAVLFKGEYVNRQDLFDQK